MTVERIVVGVDGSDNSRVALAWAADLAGALDAEVIAVHAFGLLESVAAEPGTTTEDRRRQIEHRFTTDWSAVLDEKGVRADRRVCDGDPVSVLLRVADETDADLVVVGSRGLGGHPELLLGSTSSHVAQQCRRPVVIIPHERE
jgi:nucleotide-binding universal stress UspA family protein